MSPLLPCVPLLRRSGVGSGTTRTFNLARSFSPMRIDSSTSSRRFPPSPSQSSRARGEHHPPPSHRTFRILIFNHCHPPGSRGPASRFAVPPNSIVQITARCVRWLGFARCFWFHVCKSSVPDVRDNRCGHLIGWDVNWIWKFSSNVVHPIYSHPMLDYAAWPAKRLSVPSLLLDTQNPRLPQSGGALT